VFVFTVTTVRLILLQDVSEAFTKAYVGLTGKKNETLYLLAGKNAQITAHDT
jgi:hypothetical protein